VPPPPSDVPGPLAPVGFELRELTSKSDYEQCLRLQQATWGEDFRELVPPTILRISQKVGGVVAGAVTDEGEVLGFVYGLTGVRAGEIAHWSHMLAVRDDARGLGLGKRLKIYQRERLLELGCEVMYWTFDPLVARNANLNLARLGALPCEYVVDMYGTETGSDLHSGLGTDRFVVEWRFGDPEVARRLAAGARWTSPSPPEGAVVVEPSDDVGAGIAKLERERPAGLWVRVPPDIDRLKRADRGAALRWRDAMRASMVWAFGAGYRVRGLAGDLRADGTVWYHLDRGGG
jgi:predicted GNAT superfamily acetyltransferase